MDEDEDEDGDGEEDENGIKIKNFVNKQMVLYSIKIVTLSFEVINKNKY